MFCKNPVILCNYVCNEIIGIQKIIWKMKQNSQYKPTNEEKWNQSLNYNKTNAA